MKKYIGLAFVALGMTLTSCDDYLDKLPDNRMELKTPEEITDLMVSAYADHHPAYILEMASDNADDCVNTGWTEYDRLQRQAWHWDDITEIGQSDSPQELWNNYYRAIAATNAAIEYIESLPVEKRVDFSKQLGEALMCRAYNMFMLSTVFCEAYDEASAGTNLGLPYPKKTETKVGETYERGTLKELYDNIAADIEMGLPLVKNTYDRPKFHFTIDAANAFAARFYLYYGKYDKAIACANKVLGENPKGKLRDWATFGALSANKQIAPEAYISAEEKANLLLIVTYSSWGVVHGNYSSGCKYAHGSNINTYETINAPGPWGESGSGNSGFNIVYFSNRSNSKFISRKVPYEFEYTDVQARIGYGHSEMSAFNTDMLLLERAEAYALQGNLEAAIRDVNTELSVFHKAAPQVTVAGVKAHYDTIQYYRPIDTSEDRIYYTPKKHLHPKMITLTEGSEQEAVLQTILQLRRVLTLHEGIRFQDIKRYGIVIYRRTMNSAYQITQVTDSMTVDDPRRAIQLPQDVISAGLQANPRK